VKKKKVPQKGKKDARPSLNVGEKIIPGSSKPAAKAAEKEEGKELATRRRGKISEFRKRERVAGASRPGEDFVPGENPCKASKDQAPGKKGEKRGCMPEGTGVHRGLGKKKKVGAGQEVK